MCGIGASLNTDTEAAAHELASILSRITHRGEPELQHETGSVPLGRLGTNRLAIMSRAQTRWRQPAQSACGNITLVYNGEVYNFRELANELNLSFTDVESRGDIQAIVELIARHGERAVAQLDGMYALIWHDARTGAFYAARDRLGIKPLYISSSSRRVLLASELKALADIAGVREVIECEPGSTLQFRWSPTHGWKSTEVGRRPLAPPADVRPVDVTELAHQLDKAVAEALDTRERVGVYLSGGLDSGSILALAQARRRDIVPLILNGPRAVDAPYALRLAHKFDLPAMHDTVPDERKLFEDVEKVIEITESFEPNVVRQSAVQYYISKLARSADVKVVLTGEGADELFCGYPEFKATPRDWAELRLKFLTDLHRTQLQRVDRMSMHFTTEVRVPFLRERIVDIALGSTHLPSFVERGRKVVVKKCLREAMRGHLPSPWLEREKVVLSEGVGLGGNDPERGLFGRMAASLADRNLLARVQEDFPDWHVTTTEEALYFSIFARLGYTKLRSAQNRVTVNRIASLRGGGGLRRSD